MEEKPDFNLYMEVPPEEYGDKAVEFAIRLFESVDELDNEPESKLLQLSQEEKIQIPVSRSMDSLADALSVVFYRRRSRRLGFYTVQRRKCLGEWQYSSQLDFDRYVKAIGETPFPEFAASRELRRAQ